MNGWVFFALFLIIPHKNGYFYDVAKISFFLQMPVAFQLLI